MVLETVAYIILYSCNPQQQKAADQWFIQTHSNISVVWINNFVNGMIDTIPALYERTWIDHTGPCHNWCFCVFYQKYLKKIETVIPRTPISVHLQTFTVHQFSNSFNSIFDLKNLDKLCREKLARIHTFRECINFLKRLAILSYLQTDCQKLVRATFCC